MQTGDVVGHTRNREHAQGERNENGNAAEARQRSGVQVPLLGRDLYAPVAGREVPYITSQNEREKERQEKNRKKS
jgi:hypothetical protein